MLEKLFPYVFSIKLRYLRTKGSEEDLNLLDVYSREIPIKKLFDQQTRQGGFDAFMHLPPGMEGRRFKPFSETTSNHLPDGSVSDKNMEKLIWRARACVPEEIDYLRAGQNVFTVEGVLNDAARMQNEINELANEAKFINGKVDSLTLNVGSLSQNVSSLAETAKTTLQGTALLAKSSKQGLRIGIIALLLGLASLFVPLCTSSIKELSISQSSKEMLGGQASLTPKRNKDNLPVTTSNSTPINVGTQGR
ncbi:MAG: hypothetical protein V1797_18575 [Pseudomonadota bacterium]